MLEKSNKAHIVIGKNQHILYIKRPHIFFTKKHSKVNKHIINIGALTVKYKGKGLLKTLSYIYIICVEFSPNVFKVIFIDLTGKNL